MMVAKSQRKKMRMTRCRDKLQIRTHLKRLVNKLSKTSKMNKTRLNRSHIKA
jgi:hypothetical protein